MKKLLTLFLSAILMVACVLSVSATQDNTGADLGPYPDTPDAEINYLTQDNFPNTEGFTDYPILKNDNVKWYYYKTDDDKASGVLTEFTYKYESVDGLAHGAMLGDCRSAFQVFKWNNELMNPWFYNGIKLEMSDIGVIEINFKGSAINLICAYLANPTTGVMTGAKVQVDDGEWQTVGYEEFTAVDNTLEGRSVMKRWFKVDNLEYGSHTVRIMNDCLGGGRLPIDAYEVRESEAPVTTEPVTTEPVTSDTIADTSDSAVSTTEAIKDTSGTSGEATTTISDTSSDIAGDDDTSNGPTVGIIIGIIAAAVVVAVVVVIIVKKRKS